MSSPGKTPKHIKLDERNHVEIPLLDQLVGLEWEVIDLTDMKQTPADTHRESFTEVVMTPVLREQLNVINPWLEDDQVEEVVKQLTASFPSTGLLENNKHLLQLLLENTSVSENRHERREQPDRPLRGLCDPRQQPLHRGLPVQGPCPRHRAPHHSRRRAVSSTACQWW